MQNYLIILSFFLILESQAVGVKIFFCMKRKKEDFYDN